MDISPRLLIEIYTSIRVFFFQKWNMDLAIGPACFQLHGCHHHYGPQVWQLVFFFFFLPCERNKLQPPDCVGNVAVKSKTAVAHIKKSHLALCKMALGEFLHWSMCVLPVWCTTLCFYLSVKWQCIFTQDYLNFRWEEENQIDRQRGESCLEWGESSTQTHAHTKCKFRSDFAPR